MIKQTLIGAGALIASAAWGQTVEPIDPARQLSTHLNTLSSDGKNLWALIGAGEAAVELEDAQAAIGFFGRAQEIDPRNPRVRAGQGRALLLLERPRDALMQFDAARALGAPEPELSIDRGLAYDLLGDQKSAQRDYQIATRGPDADEATRRLAISLAISGERERALNLLEPLQRRDDRAAWRARAFVLALSGDVDGANGVLGAMNPQLARPMAPFFARLGGLSPAQKAQAAHLGVMPANRRNDGAVLAAATRPTQRAGVVLASGALPTARPGDGLIPAGPALGARPAQTQTTPLQVAPATPVRRPETQSAMRFNPAPAASALARVATAPSAERPPAVAPPVRLPIADLLASKSVAPAKPAGSTLETAIDRTRDTAPGFASVLPPAVGSLEPIDAPALPVGAPRTDPALAVVTPVEPAITRKRSLADIAGGLTLEQAAAVAPPRPLRREAVARPLPAKAEVKLAAPKASAKKKPEAVAKPDPKTANPARVWAQVATGSDRKALAADYGRLAKKAPAAFKGQGGYVAPFKSTRRLLVGPFANEKAAQAFIKKAGVPGFAWTSPAGTEVEKLGAR